MAIGLLVGLSRVVLQVSKIETGGVHPRTLCLLKAAVFTKIEMALPHRICMPPLLKALLLIPIIIILLFLVWHFVKVFIYLYL